MHNSIQPQAVSGRHRTFKNLGGLLLLVIYIFGSWLRWDRGHEVPSQALMIDLGNRRAYIFAVELWPQEMYYITALLILAAMGLFFVTSLFGRIWCGYTCPHTVFVDIFRHIEHFFQGDRNARIKLNQSHMDGDKFMRKIATHGCWILVGFLFAFGWVSYFYDTFQLMHDIKNFTVSKNGTIWLMALTTTTYLFAGFLRERTCLYMCPYGRFQSAMLDNNTYVVHYNEWRGEPRGKQSSGDCIDCGKCVLVCPMGIDIRNGLQLACIGCGLCIDACNSVMQQLQRPLGLVSYDSVNSSNSKKHKIPQSFKTLRTKTAMFGAIFLLVSSATLYAMTHRSMLSSSIERSRGALYTVLPDGSVRNQFIIKMLNKYSHDTNCIMSIESPHHLTIASSLDHQYSNELVINIPKRATEDLNLLVRLEQKELKNITHKTINSKIIINCDKTSNQQNLNFILPERYVYNP